jgi:hypothetical protein
MANTAIHTVDAVLVACPACKAWPMAVNIGRPAWASRPKLQFTCAKCRFTAKDKADLAGNRETSVPADIQHT